MMARIGKMNKRDWKIIGIFAMAGLAMPVFYPLYAMYIEPIREWRPEQFLGGVGNPVLFPGVRGVFGAYDGPPPSWWYIGKLWIEASIRNVIIYALIGLAIASVLKLARTVHNYR
jgi:hypothetical protein